MAATLCSMGYSAKELAVMRAQGKRLAEARNQAGYKSGRAAALENEWPESTYSAHEGGRRKIGEDDADRYLRVFRHKGAKATTKTILFGDDSQEIAPPFAENEISRIPLLDVVAAGRLVEPKSQIPVEDVPLLAFADLGPGEWFALRVQGNSMDKVSPDGSIIVVNRRDKQLVSGKCYVFSIRGETTYKRWQGGEPPYLEPYSSDNDLNKPIFPKRKRDLEVIGRVKRTVLDL